jgi:hypothetical protein
MYSTFNLSLEDAILSTNAEPLAAINVGILHKDGNIQEVITLEELARVGNSQSLNMHNYENFGDVEYAFTISDADNLRAKVAYLRDQPKKQTSND